MGLHRGHVKGEGLPDERGTRRRGVVEADRVPQLAVVHEQVACTPRHGHSARAESCIVGATVTLRDGAVGVRAGQHERRAVLLGEVSQHPQQLHRVRPLARARPSRAAVKRRRVAVRVVIVEIVGQHAIAHRRIHRRGLRVQHERVIAADEPIRAEDVSQARLHLGRQLEQLAEDLVELENLSDALGVPQPDRIAHEQAAGTAQRCHCLYRLRWREGLAQHGKAHGIESRREVFGAGGLGCGHSGDGHDGNSREQGCSKTSWGRRHWYVPGRVGTLQDELSSRTTHRS